MIHRDLKFMALTAFSVLFSSAVHGLGIGGAESNSFIGQPLSVRIPLFNVSQPNSIEITIDSDQFDGLGQPSITAELDRSNSQLAIKVTTDQIINEPYISFSLDLVDANSEFNKEFIVLMDLPEKPISGVSSQNSNVISGVDGPSVLQSSAISSFESDSDQYTDELMGPYETAQAGRIPKKFGAVLNGQSLWRVARRINGAMGVTKSQMIWALYQANPKAFSTKSITSLKAGVFLDIPPQSIVESVSDEQAQANLRALRVGVNDVNTKVEPVVDSAFSDTQKRDSVSDDASLVDQFAESDSFQVTNVGSSSDSSGTDQGDQSQEIISSLTETVSSMSQQLERKDRKIEFLESQVSELTSFIASNNAGSPEIVEELSSSLEAVSDTQVLLDEGVELAQIETETETETEIVNVESTSVNSNQKSFIQFDSIWKWLLLGFALIAALVFLLRNRIASLGRSLNLFGANEHVELRTVMIQESNHLDLDSLDELEPSINSTSSLESDIANVDEIVKENLELVKQSNDTSILEAVEESLADPDTLSSMSYLDMAEDEDELLDFETAGLNIEVTHDDEADLSFDERFNQLLKDKDFDFARELLDFARYNEIDDDRYHCERLRLCERVKDEDAFYEYYYEIESKIPSFSQELQTQISQLVVELAHH